MFETNIVGTTAGSDYGKFKFEHMPSPGDQIVIGNIRGSLDILRVLYIEHHPVETPTSKLARQDPCVTIVVEFVESDGD